MGRRLHRDPSSLSRFEAGKSKPRDAATVDAAYRLLTPLSIPAKPRRRKQTHAPRWIAWWAIARYALLAGGVLAVTSDTIRAAEVRTFGIVSAIGLLVLLYWRLRKSRAQTMTRMLVAARDVGVPLLLAAYWASRLTISHVDPLTIAAVLWLELGYVIWGYDHYRRA